LNFKQVKFIIEPEAVERGPHDKLFENFELELTFKPPFIPTPQQKLKPPSYLMMLMWLMKKSHFQKYRLHQKVLTHQ